MTIGMSVYGGYGEKGSVEVDGASLERTRQSGVEGLVILYLRKTGSVNRLVRSIVDFPEVFALVSPVYSRGDVIR